MTRDELEAIKVDLQELEQRSSSLSWREVETLLGAILSRLLREDGFDVEVTSKHTDGGVDFIAERAGDKESEAVSIGIQCKHYQKPVGAGIVRSLLGTGMLSHFDRVLLVTTSRFLRDAQEIATRELPVRLELVDLVGLRAWISRVGYVEQSVQSAIFAAIVDLSRKLARFIADDPRSLREIEWRDLERVLAVVFEGIGFKVELTPGSKDLGKDIILQCRVGAENRSYIVEVKHWRSGKRVGKKDVSDFINVVANEERDGGIFISSSGYSDGVEALTEIERQHVRLGGEEKIVSLCKTFKKRESGLWSAPEALPQILFAGTK